MITQKLKICSDCNLPKQIYKNFGRDKLCKQCTYLRKTPSKIVPRSSKKITQDKLYSIKAIEFKTKHPVCELNLTGCSRVTCDVHHLYSGIDRNKYYLDISTWKATCRSCHHLVHDVMSSEELQSMGLRLIDN